MKTFCSLILLGLLATACGKKTEDKSPPKTAPSLSNQLINSNLTPNSLIEAAVQVGDVEATQVAIGRDANIDLILPNGSTLLTHAVANNFSSVAQILLDAGADARKRDRNGQNPVILAMELNQSNIAQQLLLHGASIDAQDLKGRSLLLMSIAQKDEEMAEWLIDQGANLDLIDFEGVSAAKLAQDLGLTNLVKLIDLRMNLAEGMSSEEVLKLIFQQVDVEGLRIALQKSPSILRIALATSPLFQAVQGEVRSKIPEMALLILDQGLSPNGQSSDPRSPLSEAAFRGLTETVELLIKKGAEIEYKDGFGQSALLHAVMGNQPSTVSKLIESNAKKNYYYHMNDRRNYMSACSYAKRFVITNDLEKERNKEIRNILMCSGRRFYLF